MNAADIDYNYYTHPDTLQAWIDKAGGLAAVLTFCTLNTVEVIRGEDWSYGAYINKTGTWSTDMDALSALVNGIRNYQEHNPVTHGTET